MEAEKEAAKAARAGVEEAREEAAAAAAEEAAAAAAETARGACHLALPRGAARAP